MKLLWAVAAIRSEVLDTIFSLITKIGEEIVVIVVLCAIFWCIDKKLAYCIGISYFLSGLMVQGLKISFRIDRPWILDSSFSPVASAIEHASGYSFPSGHTQSVSALFGTLGFSLKKRWQQIICFVVIILVCFSRMYLGVHTLLDVGVSMILSFAIAYLAVRFYGRKDHDTLAKQISLPIVLTLIALLIVLLSFIFYSSGAIEEEYVIDCLKAAGAGIGFSVGMFLEQRYIKFSTKCRNLWMQVVKLVLGMVGVLAVKEGLKLIIGTGMVVDTIRYILIGLFITAIYPYIISKLFEKKEDV